MQTIPFITDVTANALDRDRIAQIVAEAYDGDHTQACPADYRVADAVIRYVREHAGFAARGKEPDDLADFLDQRATRDEAAYTRSIELYDAYRLWAARHDRRRLTHLAFARMMHASGHAMRRVGSEIQWQGIRIAAGASAAPAPDLRPACAAVVA